MKEPADLEDGEEDLVLTDDDVVDRADPLVMVVDDAASHELARAVALRHRRHVDGDQIDRCLRASVLGLATIKGAAASAAATKILWIVFMIGLAY